MAIPSGAYAVKYSISCYDESDSDPEISFDVQFPVNSGSPQGVNEDAAAQAAMEAYITVLETAYPTETVGASRQYLCRVDGDTWPAP